MSKTPSPLRLRLSKYKRKFLERRVISLQKRSGKFVFIHIPKCGGTSLTEAIGQSIKLHDTATERRDKLGQERWDQLYKFSTVRHPYDRVASFYSFSKNTHYVRQSQIGELELSDWVRAAFRDKDPRYHFSLRSLAPCTRWITDDDGNLMVDDVYKLEEIDDAWPELRKKTGLTTKLPHRNATSKGGGVSGLDREARVVIQDHFQEDFIRFGYAP